MRAINLFDRIPEDFFKPSTSIHKKTYIDCINLIYNTYQNELSFGVDKEIIIEELSYYFDKHSSEDIVFDENENTVKDSRTKSNSVLVRLKESGWIEIEQSNDYKLKVNLLNHAVTMIESFNKITQNEEIEYQSLVAQIHTTLLDEKAYIKPYEYIIKRVIENTEELIIGLKKLSTNIKNYISDITNEKTTSEILEDFFNYQDVIASKAYHRIKTSDNISYFRTSIVERLNNILSDEDIFNNSVSGYMEIEQIESQSDAKELLTRKLVSVISAFRNYDDIISEIDRKNSQYLSSAVARANFLISNTNNEEGKISKILAYISDDLNKSDSSNLNDYMDNEILGKFNIFPQRFIDNDSLYTVPISKSISLPKKLHSSPHISDEERKLRKLKWKEKNKNKFSKKKINDYIIEVLTNKKAILASTLPLESKKDLIRIAYISVYGSSKNSVYKITTSNQLVSKENYKFYDFLIERCEE